LCYYIVKSIYTQEEYGYIGELMRILLSTENKLQKVRNRYQIICKVAALNNAKHPNRIIKIIVKVNVV